MSTKTVQEKRVVITGLSGNIGHILYAGLKGKWTISGIDKKNSWGLPVSIGDISAYTSIAGNRKRMQRKFEARTTNTTWLISKLLP